MTREEITAVRDAASNLDAIASRFPEEHTAAYIIRDAMNRLYTVARHFEQKLTV